MVWDIFLLDPDFRIERPTRYLYQGLNILQGEGTHEHTHVTHSQDRNRPTLSVDRDDATDRMSLLGSIKSRFSRVLSSRHSTTVDTPRQSISTRPRSGSDTSSSSSSSASDSRPPTPLLDPSTNTNPITEDGQGQQVNDQRKKKKKSRDMSKHTFYIVNSQQRLKLFARSEVR